MSIWMCPKCKVMYDADNFLTPYISAGRGYQTVHYSCPNIDCDGADLVEIDDMMVRPIYLLNHKGYITEFCCSGHTCSSRYVDRSRPYIAFDKIYKFPSMPEYWEVEETELARLGKVSRMQLKSDASLDRYIYMQALEDWCESLPIYKEK